LLFALLIACCWCDCFDVAEFGELASPPLELGLAATTDQVGSVVSSDPSEPRCATPLRRKQNRPVWLKAIHVPLISSFRFGGL